MLFCTKTYVGMRTLCCFFFLVRKLIKSPGETVIRIFKFLPKYIKEAELAKQFVDILLLFMEKKTQSSGERIAYISSFPVFIFCFFDINFYIDIEILIVIL